MLVSRQVDLVYSVALRQLRDVHLAEEVIQATSIILPAKRGRSDQRLFFLRGFAARLNTPLRMQKHVCWMVIPERSGMLEFIYKFHCPRCLYG